MGKIIINIDFFDHADYLIDYGLEMARELSGNIQLIHVVESREIGMEASPTGHMTDAGIEQTLLTSNKENADKWMQEKVRKIEEQIKGNISIEGKVIIGIKPDVLLSESSNKETELILTGDDHESGLIAKIAGSDTKMIIDEAKCPVLFVPRNYAFKGIKQIIYATDYEKADVDTLQKTINLFKVFDPSITAVHQTKNIDFQMKIKQRGFLDIVRQKLDFDQINFITVNGQKDVQEIIDYAQKIDCDMIIVLKQNRDFLEKLFHSSSSHKIVAKSNIPVLVYHEQ